MLINIFLKAKKKTKLENKDKPKQTPKTIENCRVKDETYLAEVENDQELQLDLRTDELSKHLTRLPNKKVLDDQLDDEDDGVNSDVNSSDEVVDEDERAYKAAEKEKSAEKDEDGEEVDVDDGDDSENENTDPKILITTTELKISFKTYKLCRELSRILPNAQYFYRKNVRITKVIPEAIKRDYSAILVVNENRKEPSMF